MKKCSKSLVPTAASEEGKKEDEEKRTNSKAVAKLEPSCVAGGTEKGTATCKVRWVLIKAKQLLHDPAKK